MNAFAAVSDSGTLPAGGCGEGERERSPAAPCPLGGVERESGSGLAAEDGAVGGLAEVD